MQSSIPYLAQDPRERGKPTEEHERIDEGCLAWGVEDRFLLH
jgi:hypothetical protein